jgi:hypothetical protein
MAVPIYRAQLATPVKNAPRGAGGFTRSSSTGRDTLGAMLAGVHVGDRLVVTAPGQGATFTMRLPAHRH